MRAVLGSPSLTVRVRTVSEDAEQHLTNEEEGLVAVAGVVELAFGGCCCCWWWRWLVSFRIRGKGNCLVQTKKKKKKKKITVCYYFALLFSVVFL